MSGEAPPTTTEPDEAAPNARASNISGICDPELDALLDDGTDEQVGEYLASQALSLPLMGDRVVVGRSAELAGPPGRVASWPVGERSGPFVTVPEWFRADSSGSDDDETHNDTDTTRETDNE